MKAVKKRYLSLGTAFTAVSLIMLLSNHTLLSFHENIHIKSDRSLSSSINNDSSGTYIKSDKEKCFYCDLLISSSKFFSCKNSFNSDFTIITRSLLLNFKDEFRSVNPDFIKARSPPFSFFIPRKAA